MVPMDWYKQHIYGVDKPEPEMPGQERAQELLRLEKSALETTTLEVGLPPIMVMDAEA